MSTFSAFRPEPISASHLASPYHSEVQPLARQCLSQEPDGLTTIFQPDVNLAVWQRHVSSHLHSYAHQLQTQLTLPLQCMLSLSDIPHELSNALPEGEGRDLFIADISQLAEMFACLMDCNEIGLRLRVLDKPMCPKFHTDHLVCRLVSSYTGPATEWHAGPVDAPMPTQQLQCGDVALLKGSGWENSGCYAISHRSPAATNKRLLLTMDPVWS